MEQQSIICPNCGAVATNPNNCEYCGSLLVRFAFNNEDIDETVFGEKSQVIPGLETALNESLMIQETLTQEQLVITSCVNSNDAFDAFQFFPTKDVNCGTQMPNPFGEISEPSLSLRLSFGTKLPNEEEANQQRECYRRFKSLKLSNLFVELQWEYGVDYYINFGKDAKNAAHISTAIFKSMAGWNKTTKVDIDNQILQKEELAFGSESGQWTKKKIILASAALIIAYIIFMLLIN